MSTGDIRGRLLAPFLSVEQAGGVDRLDEERLVEALILMEQVVLKSYALSELPSLVATFGAEGLCRLLDSGALKLQVVPHVLGENGSPDSPTVFHFIYLTAKFPRDHIGLLLADELPKLSHLSEAQRARIDEALRRSEVDVGPDLGHSALSGLQSTLLEGRPIIRKAIALHGGEPLPVGGEIVVRQIDGEFFDIDPSWTRSMPPERRRALTQQSLFAVANLQLRIEEMRVHNALTGFENGDLPMLDEHLRFLERQIEVTHHVGTFRRVLEVAGIPTVASRLAGQFVDVDALLKVRAARETIEFRSWLWSMHDATDAEIRDRVRGFGASVGRLLQTTGGKALRWVTGTGVGLVPGVGTVAGAALGLADAFLLDKVFPTRGVVSFLDGLFPTIFTSNPRP